MFLVCSNVIEGWRYVKPQGNGVTRDRRTPNLEPCLDVRDVDDENRCSQHAGEPDESRIRVFVHSDPYPSKSGVLHIQIMCQNPHHPLKFKPRHHLKFPRRLPRRDHIPLSRIQASRSTVAHCRSNVLISISDFSVRCTGHLSAISSSRLRCSASSGPSIVILRSMRSTMPSLVSQLRQSSAWILLCGQPHGDALERQLLAVGIKPQRHRGAGAEPGEQEIVRTGPGVEPADLDGLVGQKPVRPAQDLLLEFSLAGFAHKNSRQSRSARRFARSAARDNARPRRRSRSPHRPHRSSCSADDRRRRATRNSWDAWRPGISATHCRCSRCRRSANGISAAPCARSASTLRDALFGNVIEEFALDPERASGQRHFDLALFADLVDLYP